MKGFVGLTKRNLLLYFKDGQNIFFSLLTSIIVFVLYILFLKGTFVDAIEGAMEGLEELVNANDTEMLVSGILLCGVVGTALITIPYNCLTTIVKDKENKVDYDILATPVKRGQIILSYFLASTISAFLMTSLIYTVGIIVLNCMGNPYISAGSVALGYGLLLLGSASATAFFMLVVMFFKTLSASNAFFGLLASASGFVIGAYIPISAFSTGVQTVCNIFPASHIVIMLRNVILNGVLDHMNGDINGLDGGTFVEAIKDKFTFNAKLFDNALNIREMLVYVIAAAAICILAMVLVYNKNNQRK